MGRGLGRATGPFAAALGLFMVGLLCAASGASATTICVPAFTSACPNSGGNVAVADFEKAMSTQDSDEKADEIRVAAGTFTENATFEPPGGSPGTLEPQGKDTLTIVGAGQGQTVLTSAGTGNVFLFNLDFNNTRKITIRDLTIRVPASFDDGLGAAVQLAKGDVLEGVSVTSANPGSDGILAVGAGNVVRGGKVSGEGSGTIDYGVGVTSTSSSLLVEDEVVADASWALVTGAKDAQLTARRVAVEDAATYGAIASAGTIDVADSTFRLDDAIGLYASSAADPSTVMADHVTMLDSVGSYPALEVKKFGGGARRRDGLGIQLDSARLRERLQGRNGDRARDRVGEDRGPLLEHQERRRRTQTGRSTSLSATRKPTRCSPPTSLCSRAPLRSTRVTPPPPRSAATSSARRVPSTAMATASRAPIRGRSSISGHRPPPACPRRRPAPPPPIRRRRRRGSSRDRAAGSPPVWPGSSSPPASRARASSASSTAAGPGLAGRRGSTGG